MTASFVERWHLGQGLVGLAVGVFAAVGSAWLSAGLRRRAPIGRRMDFPLWCAVAAVGVWATVPDTEAPLLVATVSIPALVLVWRSGVPLPGWWRIVAVAVVAFGSWSGSARWVTALLGASCCVALPAVAAAATRMWRPGALNAVFRSVLAAAHLIANVLGSRVVAHSTEVRAAWVSGAVVVGVAALVAWAEVSAAPAVPAVSARPGGGADHE